MDKKSEFKCGCPGWFFKRRGYEFFMGSNDKTMGRQQKEGFLC